MAALGPAGETLVKVWVVLDTFFGHRYVEAAADIWTIYSNAEKARHIGGEKRATAELLAVGETGELFTSLEALKVVDKACNETLGILTDGGPEWDCAMYRSSEYPMLMFTSQGFFPGTTFESDNAGQSECLMQLKASLGFIRHTICNMESKAEEWAQTMARSASDPDFWKGLLQFNSKRTCIGAALPRELLSERFRRELLDEPIRTCARHGGATEECSAECARIRQCTAVTLDAMEGACCFLTGKVETELLRRRLKRSTRSSACLRLTARERFLMLDADGASQWLQRRGFGEHAHRAREFLGVGLTGMTLSFLTQPMLEKWLASEGKKMDRGEELHCRIRAELDNDPWRDCTAKAQGALSKLVSFVEAHTAEIDRLMLAPRGAKCKFFRADWVLDFLRKSRTVKGAAAAWTVLFDIVNTAKNAQRFVEIIQGGRASLKPMVFLKACLAVSAMIVFQETTAFHRCDRVQAFLAPVITRVRLLRSDTESQMEYIAALMARGM